MGAIRYPNPTGYIPGLDGVDAGTLARTDSPTPLSAGVRAWHRFKRVLQYINPVERGRCLMAVYRQGSALAPEEIEREVPGVHEIVTGLLEGLLQALLVIGLTTAVGAVAGGVIGAFFGGVGAIPGAAAGGEVGFDAGVAILTWLGLGFLIVMIASDLGEVVNLVKSAAKGGWEAAEHPPLERQQIIARAGHDLARAAAVLMRLIFQAIVAYLLHKGSGAVREQVGPLVEKLRASKFGASLAEYVEKNWRKLVEDPRFKPKAGAPGGEEKAGGGAAPGSSLPPRPGNKATGSEEPPPPPPKDDEPGPPPRVKPDYATIPDPPEVKVGGEFTAKQKADALALNRAANDGVVRSDGDGRVLTRPQKSQRGVTPAPEEWQFDHIVPKDKGGTNASSNLQILSRAENRLKSNRHP